MDNLFPRGNIIGVHISAINMNDALEALQLWISTRQPHYISVTAVAAILEGHGSAQAKLAARNGLAEGNPEKDEGFTNGPDQMVY